MSFLWPLLFSKLNLRTQNGQNAFASTAWSYTILMGEGIFFFLLCHFFPLRLIIWSGGWASNKTCLCETFSAEERKSHEVLYYMTFKQLVPSHLFFLIGHHITLLCSHERHGFCFFICRNLAWMSVVYQPMLSGQKQMLSKVLLCGDIVS